MRCKLFSLSPLVATLGCRVSAVCTAVTQSSCSSVLSVREELERQKSKERYQKLQMEGKTEQARADLARLAIIKKQREEAAKKREELRKGEKATSDT